jgi:hypothetical protein
MTSSIDKKKIFNELNLFEKPTINNLLKVIIENIDKFDINGDNKKEVAIDILKDYLIVIPPSAYKEALSGAIDNNIISEIIDLVILASKNKLQINKKSFKKLFINCLKCILHISK